MTEKYKSALHEVVLKGLEKERMNNSSELCRMPVDHVCWERCDQKADEHYHNPAVPRCPGCGHMAHKPGECLNMASDNDCDCKYAAPSEKHVRVARRLANEIGAMDDREAFVEDAAFILGQEYEDRI